MEGALSQQIAQQYAAGLKFMAIDTDSYRQDGFGRGISIINSEVPPLIQGMPMKSLMNILAVQLKEMFNMNKMPVTTVSMKNGYEVGKIISQITYTFGKKKYDATVTQYIVIDKAQANMYTLTLSSARKSAAKNKVTLDQIAGSFKLLEE